MGQRKSIAQLQNEQISIGRRIQELNNWLYVYTAGGHQGNPKTLIKRARAYENEIRKLQNKAQKINMQYEQTIREQVY